MPARARRATSRWPGPRRRCARSCSSSTPGPGVRRRSATRGCPTGIGPELRERAAATGTKVLLIRRPEQGVAHACGSPGLRGVRPPRRAVARDHRPRRPARRPRPRPRGARRGPVARADPARRPGARRLHPRPARQVLRRARPAGRGRPGRGVPRPDLGGEPHRRRPVRRATCWCCRTASTSAGSRPTPPAAWRGCWPPASSTSTTCAAAPGWRRRCRRPRPRCGGTSTSDGSTAVRFVSREVSDGTHRGGVRRRRSPVRRRGDAAPAASDLQRLTCRGAARESASCTTSVARDPGALSAGASVALLGAAHPGPAFAVTLLAGLLAGAVGLGPATLALVVAAVLTGQLSIGWSNDLDRPARATARSGATDKPLVDGRVSERTVRIACALALVATVPLSLACGWLAGAGPPRSASPPAGPTTSALKSTPWSWLPYAVAFGGLPAFVSLTDNPDQVPPLWLVAGRRAARRRCAPRQRAARPRRRRGHRRPRACRTGSARAGARWSRPRCSSRPRW